MIKFCNMQSYNVINNLENCLVTLLKELRKQCKVIIIVKNVDFEQFVFEKYNYHLITAIKLTYLY